MIRREIFLLLCCLVINITQTYAQSTNSSEPIVLEALFELPVVPDEITDIMHRSNYFVEHFWDPMDFKQTAVGQHQLNHAFSEYVVGLRFCDRTVAMKSVEKLISKLNKNTTLLYQFTRAAEDNLYSETAEIWIDEIYLKFIEAVVKNKKIKKERKIRYITQYESLKNSIIGSKAQKFEFIDRSGTKTMFSAEAKPTIIIFGSPDCIDCMMTKVRLNSDEKIIQLAKDNEIKIYFIIPDGGDDNWKNMVADYPHYWTVGVSDSVSDIYDIRLSPTIYLLNSERKIELKNVAIETIISTIIKNN